jgi:hypothetical protein
MSKYSPQEFRHTSSLAATASFRRPRRASQAQRKAARNLGRKRRGKSVDRWKGLKLPGLATKEQQAGQKKARLKEILKNLTYGAGVVGGALYIKTELEERRARQDLVENSGRPEQERQLDVSNMAVDSLPDARVKGYKGLSLPQREAVIQARKTEMFGLQDDGGGDVYLQGQMQRVPFATQRIALMEEKKRNEERGGSSKDYYNRANIRLLKETFKAERKQGSKKYQGKTAKAVRQVVSGIDPDEMFNRIPLPPSRFRHKDAKLATFRRPRRATRLQKLAAKKLGLRRRGRSRNRWKGIALAGGAAVGIGAVAVHRYKNHPKVLRSKMTRMKPGDGAGWKTVDVTNMNKFFSVAKFRRPRRASQAQRRAAQLLGRKRKGKSRTNWKGIALAGTGTAGLAAIALRGRNIVTGETPLQDAADNVIDAAKAAPGAVARGVRHPVQSAKNVGKGVVNAVRGIPGAKRRANAEAIAAPFHLFNGAASLTPPMRRAIPILRVNKQIPERNAKKGKYRWKK